MIRRPPPNSRRAGYSLFETLLAFALLAAVLAVLLPGQSQLLKRFSRGSEAVLAQDYTHSLLDLIGLGETPQPRASQFAYRDWTISQDITAHPEISGFLRVTVTVFDDRGRVLAGGSRDVAGGGVLQ